MNTENLYINDEQFFKYCEENRLLDDTQIEVLKQAAVNVDHVFLDYFVPVGRVDQLIHYCKNKIDEYEFDFDQNFIMNSRRKTLKSMIEERLLKNNRDINELVSESLFNFFEFVSDEYPGGAGGIMSTCKELGITIKEFDSMDNEYRKKGIICIQERDVILEIIQVIKNYINERGF